MKISINGEGGLNLFFRNLCLDNREHYKTPEITFTFFYQSKIVSFQAEAKLITKQMKDVPFPLALVELETSELHDIMFYGAEIPQPPVFVKTYNPNAAKKLDEQVYASIAQ